MSVNENDRLDLRRAFEELFADPRLAGIAMEALPPIDYANLATRQDLGVLSAELRGEVATLRGELKSELAELKGATTGLAGEMMVAMANLDAKIESKSAETLKVTMLSLLSATVMLGGYVTAVLG